MNPIDALVLAIGRMVLTLLVGTIFWFAVGIVIYGLSKLMDLTRDKTKYWGCLVFIAVIFAITLSGILVQLALGF